MTLFRQEVLDQRADRLHGQIGIDIPLPWHAIGLLLLASLVAAALFLAFSSYARVEVVPGSIVLDQGLASIVPSRPGVVTILNVRENQTVTAGAPLATIRAEEDVASGVTVPEQVVRALAEQEAGLERQSSKTSSAASADRSRLLAHIHGLQEEIAGVERQIAVQAEMVASAAREVDIVREVAKRGYISRRDVLVREDTLLGRRQQMAQLEQNRAAKQAELAEAQRSIRQVEAQAEAQVAGLSSSRAQLAERRAQTVGGQGYVLVAPISGTVTAITARVGQRADQQPLMTVVPTAAHQRAELYVPTQAAGFLAAGQEVRLAIDAFPYQRFGTVAAVIGQISTSAVTRPNAAGTASPVFLVSAELKEPWVEAYGKRQRLLPGMALSARIVTQKQSLLQWLFQPLFAVRKR